MYSRHNPNSSMINLLVEYRDIVGDAYEFPVPSYISDQNKFEEGSRYKLERNLPYERPHAQFRKSYYEGTAFDRSATNTQNNNKNNFNGFQSCIQNYGCNQNHA